MTQSLRLARRTLAQVARKPARVQTRTFLAPTAALRADLVQDLYLKELKAYKPPPTKASDAEGHVLKFSVPKPPQSPEEGDLAQDLKAYEQQQVEVEGQAAAGEAEAADEGDLLDQNFFEAEEEEERAKKAH
ncbi:MAG: hypothetical protein Q9191_002216 [Dirinaria sp. TL-2023a]